MGGRPGRDVPGFRWAEARAWWAVSWPCSLRAFADIVPWLSTLAFVGRQSTLDLAALSLLETVMYGPAVCVWLGVAISQSTLVSQAHGAGNATAARGWSVIALGTALAGCTIVGTIWVSSRALLLAAGYDATLVSAGYAYALWCLPALAGEAFTTAAGTHMSALEMAGPPLAIAALVAGVDILLSYALILGRWGAPALGLQGAAIAWSARTALGGVLYALALRWSWGKELLYGGEEEEEAPSSVEEGLMAALLTVREDGTASLVGEAEEGRAEAWAWALSRSRWGMFLSLARSNCLTIGLESAQLIVLSLLAARLGATQIATHNSMLCLLEVVHTASQGMAEGTSIRVGHHLGRGNPEDARRVLPLAACVALLVSALVAGVGVGCRAWMGRIFSEDEGVVDTAAVLAAPLAATFVAWSLGDQAWGTFEGQGRSAACAVTFLAGGYGVALPLAFLLARFVPDSGLLGIWWSLAAGYIVSSALAWLLVLTRSDWPALAAAAAAGAAEEGEPSKVGTAGGIFGLGRAREGGE